MIMMTTMIVTDEDAEAAIEAATEATAGTTEGTTMTVTAFWADAMREAETAGIMTTMISEDLAEDVLLMIRMISAPAPENMTTIRLR